MSKSKKEILTDKEEKLGTPYPTGHISQKPSNSETEITQSLLHGDFPIRVMNADDYRLGTVKFDTPHLSRHNKVPNFLVAILPVTIQEEFKSLFGNKFPAYAGDGKGTVLYSGHIHLDNISYSRIESFSTIHQFPDIFISSDINCLYHRKSKLLNERNFEAFRYSMNPAFSDSGMEHPSKLFRYLAADAMVMVADRNKFRNRQLPREWYELLNPALNSDIIFCGDIDFHCNTTFIHFVKYYGFPAIEQLTKNTLCRIHPSEMLESINSGNKLDASVYVMPYSYARHIQNNIDYQVIWPEDGAIALPIQMLVKKGAYEKHKELIRYLTGSDMGKLFAANGLVPANRNTDFEAPGEKLNWIGWDFLQEMDMTETKNEIRRIFSKIHDL
jgi:ABC-type Fe3+ transport system substrate-binding protein